MNFLITQIFNFFPNKNLQLDITLILMIVGMTIKKEDLFWFNSQQLASLDGLNRTVSA